MTGPNLVWRHRATTRQPGTFEASLGRHTLQVWPEGEAVIWRHLRGVWLVGDGKGDSYVDAQKQAEQSLAMVL